jgi:2-methylfumaryl-CoA hydratase
MRLVATKDQPCADFPYKTDDGYADGVILDFDAWFVLPRRP